MLKVRKMIKMDKIERITLVIVSTLVFYMIGIMFIFISYTILGVGIILLATCWLLYSLGKDHRQEELCNKFVTCTKTGENEWTCTVLGFDTKYVSSSKQDAFNQAVDFMDLRVAGYR